MEKKLLGKIKKRVKLYQYRLNNGEIGFFLETRNGYKNFIDKIHALIAYDLAVEAEITRILHYKEDKKAMKDKMYTRIR